MYYHKFINNLFYECITCQSMISLYMMIVL